jgi:protein SCO1/2
MLRLVLLTVGVLLLGSVIACQSPDTDPATARDAPSPRDAPTPPSVEERPAAETPYQAVGVVRSVTPSGSHIVVRHEAIPGFMDAMTMPFAVADSVSVDGLQRGDRIRFGFVAGPQGAVVQSIAPTESF